MKQHLRSVFASILKVLESGTEPFVYKASHRKILIFIGILFITLAGIVFWLAQDEDMAYLLPVLIFGGAGLLSLLVGLLGNDRAVAKIWGSR